MLRVAQGIKSLLWLPPYLIVNRFVWWAIIPKERGQATDRPYDFLYRYNQIMAQQPGQLSGESFKP
jgi:hypothetical protein